MLLWFLFFSCPQQVFSIPHVELRYRDFDLGEHSELMKRVRSLMARTGAVVELSKSKDQSLHVVVSGKRDLVLETRRQLLSALQTQVSHQIAYLHCLYSASL